MEEEPGEPGEIISLQDILPPAAAYQEDHEDPRRIGKEQAHPITTEGGHQAKDRTGKSLYLFAEGEETDPDTQN